jgi:hypothetical protein
MRRFATMLAALAALALETAPAAAGAASGSMLALPLLGPGAKPELILAQRSIERAWGASEESSYVEVAVPEWRSEGWAMAFSAAVPGAGHAYLHESGGLWFAILEVASWTARQHYRGKADRVHDSAVKLAGVPTDSSASWSFQRWEARTGTDAGPLRELYSADPDAFYHNVANDPVYAPGWYSSSGPEVGTFRSYLDDEENMLRRSRFATTAIWINHLAAGLDAFRAARLNNLPLRQNLNLKLKTGWRHGSPTLVATLERKF